MTWVTGSESKSPAISIFLRLVRCPSSLGISLIVSGRLSVSSDSSLPIATGSSVSDVLLRSRVSSFDRFPMLSGSPVSDVLLRSRVSSFNNFPIDSGRVRKVLPLRSNFLSDFKSPISLGTFLIEFNDNRNSRRFAN